VQKRAARKGIGDPRSDADPTRRLRDRAERHVAVSIEEFDSEYGVEPRCFGADREFDIGLRGAGH